jgi:hypothetical protein
MLRCGDAQEHDNFIDQLGYGCNCWSLLIAALQLC